MKQPDYQASALRECPARLPQVPFKLATDMFPNEIEHYARTSLRYESVRRGFYSSVQAESF